MYQEPRSLEDILYPPNFEFGSIKISIGLPKVKLDLLQKLFKFPLDVVVLLFLFFSRI